MDDLKKAFEEDGFIIIRGLLSAQECSDYRSKMQKLSGLNDKDFNAKKARLGGYGKPDEVTRNSVFWPIIFNQRLVNAIRQALGPDARYTQHSDIHVHHGTVGWHRDSKDRNFGQGQDWDESKDPYQIARVAIYLQSFAESGSALGVVPGSHKYESKLTKFELKLHGLIKRILGRKDILPPLLSVKPLWIKTEPGDCLIFNQRILHTGSHIRGPKYAIFLSYGADNLHSRNHRRYYLEQRKELRYSDYPSELVPQLKTANLYLDM